MTSLRSSYVLILDKLADVPRVLRSLFTDEWVASYQIGFGAPLVRSSARLITALRDARSALDRLDIYFRVCFLDPSERQRLAALFRRLMVRAHGAVEAETIRAATADVLNLEVRLHVPSRAPIAGATSMREEGVPFDLCPPDGPPEFLSGRFYVPLTDPHNQRLLEHPAVGRTLHERALHDRVGHDRVGHDRVRHDRVGHDRVRHDRVRHDRVRHDRASELPPERATTAENLPNDPVAIELRVHPGFDALWERWLWRMARISPFAPVYIAEPVPIARVSEE